MNLRVDLRVPLPTTIAELCDFVVACEAAGFDGVGIHDHPETGLDAYTALASAAARTSRLELYVAVTNVISRHPLVLASIAASMAELAPGRFRMIIGSGNVGVRQIGRQPAALSDLGTGVRSIRQLLRGSPVAFGDAPPTKLRSSPVDPPHVLIACAGPRGLDLALGEADGAFLLAGLRGDVDRWVQERLSPRPGFEVIRVIPIHISGSPAEGRRWFARWWTALHASSRPRDQWIVRSVARWADAVGAELHGESARQSERKLAELAEWVGLFGPPEYCRDRLHELNISQGISRTYLWSAHLEQSAAGIPDAYALPYRELEDLGLLLASLGTGSKQVGSRTQL